MELSQYCQRSINKKLIFQVMAFVLGLIALYIVYQSDYKTDVLVILFSITFYFSSFTIVLFASAAYEPEYRKNLVLKVYDLIWVFLASGTAIFALATLPIKLSEEAFILEQKSIQLEINSIQQEISSLRKDRCRQQFSNYQAGDFCFDIMILSNTISNGFRWNAEDHIYIDQPTVDWTMVAGLFKHSDFSYENSKRILDSIDYIRKVDSVWNHGFTYFVRENSDKIANIWRLVVFFGIAARLAKTLCDFNSSLAGYRAYKRQISSSLVS